MLSREDTLIHLDAELPGGQAWAKRHDVPFVWLAEGLEVRATFKQLESNELFYFRGAFDDYRAIAPAWFFTDASWSAAPEKRLFPQPAPSPYRSSVFHTNAVICAPFNRLAYSQHGGPHGDWGGPGNWLTAGQANEAKATCLADMLSVLHQHFRFTRGRMV